MGAGKKESYNVCIPSAILIVQWKVTELVWHRNKQNGALNLLTLTSGICTWASSLYVFQLFSKLLNRERQLCHWIKPKKKRLCKRICLIKHEITKDRPTNEMPQDKELKSKTNLPLRFKASSYLPSFIATVTSLVCWRE